LTLNIAGDWIIAPREPDAARRALFEATGLHKKSF
jgi:hypothetical protein